MRNLRYRFLGTHDGDCQRKNAPCEVAMSWFLERNSGRTIRPEIRLYYQHIRVASLNGYGQDLFYKTTVCPAHRGRFHPDRRCHFWNARSIGPLQKRKCRCLGFGRNLYRFRRMENKIPERTNHLYTSIPLRRNHKNKEIAKLSFSKKDFPAIQIVRQYSLYFGDFSLAVIITPLDNGEQPFRIVLDGNQDHP